MPGNGPGHRPVTYDFGMNLLDAFFNVTIAVVDAITLRAVARQSPARGAVTLAWSLAAILGMALLAGGMHGNAWRMMRMSAWGLFVHGGVLLAGAAACWARSSRGWAAAGALGALVVAGVGIDAFVVEPRWLAVSRVELASTKLQRPVRIVVLADLQTDTLGAYEHDVLRRVLAEKPDLILLAGDYFQAEPDQYTRLYGQLNQWMRQMGFAAPLGAYAVRGNMEEEEWAEPFEV